jgi:hypothetical protein
MYMDSPEIQGQQQALTSSLEQAEIAAKYGLAKWIFARGRDFVKGRVLEISEGEGHVADYCRRQGAYVDVRNVDLANKLFTVTYKELVGSFELVYVLLKGKELINNWEVLANSAALLKTEGCIVTVLPCSTALYEGLKQGVNDWISYNRKYIKTRMGKYFNLEKIRFFEVMESMPPLGSTKNEYEENIRLFKKTPINNFVPIGLFAIAIGRKL